VRGTDAQMAGEDITFDQLLETLKKVSALLREADVPFVLGGGIAVWARGGPETEHDLDLFLKAGDAQRALDALAATSWST
jgi:aminoglycoside-2''-adenylyltransferase